MRILLPLGAVALAAATLGGCSSNDYYASACERDYRQNVDRATAAGALIGGAAGAAIDDNDLRGGAIGAAVGGLIGNQIGRRDDPCGYGFSGYNRDGYYDRYADRYYNGDSRYGYYDSYGRWRRN